VRQPAGLAGTEGQAGDEAAGQPDDAPEDEPDPENGGLLLGPDAQGRRAAVQVSIDGNLLWVCARVRRRKLSMADHPELYNRDFLAILVDPYHDHGTRWLAAVDDRGEVTTAAGFVVQGEELADVGRARPWIRRRAL